MGPGESREEDKDLRREKVTGKPGSWQPSAQRCGPLNWKLAPKTKKDSSTGELRTSFPGGGLEEYLSTLLPPA